MIRNRTSVGLLSLCLGSVVTALCLGVNAKALPPAIAPKPLEVSSIQIQPVIPPNDPVPMRLRRGNLGMMRQQPEQHFIIMMIPHHDDAIAMAKLALERSHHPEIRALAHTIKTAQSQENQLMRTWYRQWYGAAVPDALQWHAGRGGMRGGMGGMMHTDLAELKQATDFDRAFLEEMMPHHLMGVRMAEMVLARSDRPEIQQLAKDMIRTQNAEIDKMHELYRQKYLAGNLDRY